MSGFRQDTNPSKLGGGVPGFQPVLLGGGANQNGGSGMIGGGERSLSRHLIRKAGGQYRYLYNLGVVSNNFKSGLTPFRQGLHAGDYAMASPNYSGTLQSPLLPKINQINGIGPTMLNANGDGVQTIPNGAAFSGNPHYVYDSSDYTRFKQKVSIVKTYNDKSFGGSNNGSYSFLMRVRH